MKLQLVMALSILSLSGCASLGSAAIVSTERPGVIGSGIAADALKTGEACANNILGIVLLGDSSIKAAMKEGEISTVAYVDHKVLSVLGLYGQYCTLVRGK
jgi:hypothetical protein